MAVVTRPDKSRAWFGRYAGVMLSPSLPVRRGARRNLVRRWLHAVGRRHDHWRRRHPLP